MLTNEGIIILLALPRRCAIKLDRNLRVRMHRAGGGISAAGDGKKEARSGRLVI